MGDAANACPQEIPGVDESFDITQVILQAMHKQQSSLKI
jgi:hypothetical protein